MDEPKLHAVENTPEDTHDTSEGPEDLFMHRLIKAMSSNDKQEVFRSAISMVQQGISMMEEQGQQRQNNLNRFLFDALDIMSLDCLMSHFRHDELTGDIIDRLRERVIGQIKAREKLIEKISAETDATSKEEPATQ